MNIPGYKGIKRVETANEMLRRMSCGGTPGDQKHGQLMEQTERHHIKFLKKSCWFAGLGIIAGILIAIFTSPIWTQWLGY